MMCNPCKSGEHGAEVCEHPSTCTCQHRPPRKLPTLEELRDKRKLIANAEVPPGDC